MNILLLNHPNFLVIYQTIKAYNEFFLMKVYILFSDCQMWSSIYNNYRDHMICLQWIWKKWNNFVFLNINDRMRVDIWEIGTRTANTEPFCLYHELHNFLLYVFLLIKIFVFLLLHLSIFTIFKNYGCIIIDFIQDYHIIMFLHYYYD